MTISDSDNVIQYTGNGVASTFSTGTIKFYDDTDLIVTETVTATGVDTVYVLSTDYTVSGGSGSAGSITLTAGALPSTKKITIERSIPYTQPDDYVEGENILSETIETAFDKAAIRDQQLRDKTNRSLKFKSTLSTSLAGVITEAPVNGTLLSWSGTGGNIVNASLADISTSLDSVFTSLASDDFIQYDGTNWVNKTVEEVKSSLGLPVNKFDATSAPTSDWDDSDTAGVGKSFSVGSVVVDVTNDEAYRCVDASTGAAVWVNSTLSTDELGSAALASSSDFATAAQGAKADTAVQPSNVLLPKLVAIINGTGTPAVTAQSGTQTIASITDNGTGNYTLNFGTDFADTNYIVQLSCIAVGTAATQGATINLYGSSPKAVDSLRIQVFQDSTTPAFVDVSQIYITIYGTLA